MLTLHLPRKGMETVLLLYQLNRPSQLTLHLPRKGMETFLNQESFKSAVSKLTLHLPRKGMETFLHSK